jgi:murein DD-endopeptidase MepM/ murein hydrolase activator NlpD
MRFVRGVALGALTIAALLTQTAGALALPEPGGAAAPVSAQSGGAEFGVVTTARRPVVTELRVPSTAVPGRPPTVSVEITEKGVGTVSMRLLITDLSSHRTVLTANMKWVHTGRRLTVLWAPTARLATGSYRVTVSAHDHQGANLLRSAHSSGEATLVVKAPAKPVTPAPEPSAPKGEAGVPTPAQTVADGAVFPVAGPHNFGGPENRFGAPREGHVHEGQDVLTAEGTPDLVPLAGTIEQASYQAGGAGYYVVEHTTFGLDFMFAHCMAGSFTVTEGQSVTAGQQICRAGQTGDATTPHLHFEIWVGGWQAAGGHPIDPLPYLEAWERG